MGWIKAWREKRKENREYIERIEREDIEMQVRQAESENERFKKAMFVLNCPFNDEKCHNGCAHFMPGNTYKLPQLHGGVYVGYNLPKCLLWNKN